MAAPARVGSARGLVVLVRVAARPRRVASASRARFVWPPAESSAPARRASSSSSPATSGGSRPRSRSIRRASRTCSRSRASTGRATGRRRRGSATAGRYAHARVICFDAVPYSTRGEARAVARLARCSTGARSSSSPPLPRHPRADALPPLPTRPVYAIGASSPVLRLPEEWLSETGKLIVQLTVERGC